MMFKKTLFFLLLGFILHTSTYAASYNVAADESSVHWIGTKVTGKHDGNINIQSGVMNFEGSTFTGGEAVIDMTSLTVTDIKKPGPNQNLTGHLKSDDFFDVENHETATLKIVEVTPGPDGVYELVGEFTIKGKTEKIPFKANIDAGPETASATATIKIDRTLFDVRYGSGKFFQGLGDKLIHDDFTLEISIQAKKA